MMRRQWRWISVVVAAAGLCLLFVAPVIDAGGADAAAITSPLVPASGVVHGTRSIPSPLYSGYYENLVGSVTLTSTFTVPTVKCTNHSTWGTEAAVLGLLDSSSGQIEHGGGIEIGCASVTGTPTYTAALCDPNFASGCGALADPVAQGDVVNVTVAASDGCSPLCASVVVTVNDATAPWTESWTGTSQSDFDTFVALVGAPPLPDFGKVAVTNVTINGVGLDGQRANLVDHAGRTLARASALSKGRTSFSVKWTSYS